MIGLVYGYYIKHGGVGRYLSEVLSKSSVRESIELLTIESDLFISNRIKIRKINCERDRRFLSIPENLSFSKGVAEISNNFSVLHSHGVYRIKPDIYTAHICLKSYFDRLVEFCGESSLPRDSERITDLEGEIINNSGLITSVSGKVASELSEAYGISKEKIFLIKGASRFMNNISKERTKNKQYLRLGFIGVNLKAKGIPFLVQAGNILKRQGYNIFVIGAGTNKDIEEYFRKESEFSFKLLGKVEIDPDFYESLDVFVCPSIYEAYSLTTLEAMSLNIPVVSSNLNGVFYDNPHKNLSSVEDITKEEELAEAIKKLYKDEDFRNKVVTAGKEVSLQNSWAGIAKCYDSLYDSF